MYRAPMLIRADPLSYAVSSVFYPRTRIGLRGWGTSSSHRPREVARLGAEGGWRVEAQCADRPLHPTHQRESVTLSFYRKDPRAGREHHSGVPALGFEVLQGGYAQGEKLAA